MEDFRKIEELLGWDLSDEAVQQLREARRDRESCNKINLSRFLYEQMFLIKL